MKRMTKSAAVADAAVPKIDTVPWLSVKIDHNAMLAPYTRRAP